jgi:alpha-L-rhamnosidase
VNEMMLARAGIAAPEELQHWTAAMVRPLSDQGVETRASFLRKTFSLSSPGGAETLRISALGLYRAFINGVRVGDDLLTPGWTVYSHRLSFQTYGVGHLLRAGENTIDIWLGDGWLRGQMGWRANPVLNAWGKDIAAIAELTDGAGRVVLETDTTWRSGLLPIHKNGIYFGEVYDARDEALVAESGVEALPAFDRSTLIPYEVNGVKELGSIAPVSASADSEGRMVYDFGQNVGGYIAFTVSGARGARVIVEHAEILDKDGAFYNVNYRSAEARIEYTLKGGAAESYRPTFTFFGYRYARVTIEGDARIESIVSIPISSAITPAGSFESANPLVNRLVLNTAWSQRGNFIDVPTDCPQRDERFGWTGDAQVFAPTACYLHESHQFWVKWVRDVMADQRADGAIAHVSPNPFHTHGAKEFYGSTGWGDAICIVPWVLYTHYGDRDILKEALPAMVRWNDFVWGISEGPLVNPPGWFERGFTFGDWLQPQGDFAKPYPTMGDDAAATIYLYISSHLTSKIAEIVGDDAQAKRLADRAEQVKKAFQKEFITRSGRIGYNDQSSYALAFLWDLIPPEHHEAAKGYFKDTVKRAEYRIGTGFIGTPALLPALVKIGEPELAARIFLQEEVPGWLAQVKRGATTIWERWDGIREDGSIFEPRMNSYNHYAYGAVCQWLFEGVAGFRPDPAVPAFKHIFFEPTIIPALSPVSATHDSAAGRIEAGWKVDGDRVAYEITVPEGASGTLVFSPDYKDIVVDGLQFNWSGTDKARSLLAPGRHQVTFRISR